jgi:hypothetical protein
MVIVDLVAACFIAQNDSISALYCVLLHKDLAVEIV